MIHLPSDQPYVQACAAALERALGAVPFYARWRALDPGPTAGVDERYRALPSLRKRDLRSSVPQAFVPAGRNLKAGLQAGEVELVATSGTTDERTTIVWHQPWWDFSERAALELSADTAAFLAGERREAVLTTPLCAGTVCHVGELTTAERTLGRLLFLNEQLDPAHWSVRDLQRVVRELNDFQPAVVEADPAYLAILCHYAAQHNLTVWQPQVVFLTYEFPSRAHYRQIRRVFEAPVRSSYGSTETGHVFMEDDNGRFRQIAASCRVDLQRLKDAAGPDWIGRALVTTLGNPWFALVRFDVGDLIRLREPPAKAGDGGLVALSIEGRVRDLTFDVSGAPITVGRLDRAVGEIEGLLAYQVDQTAVSRYLLRYVPEVGTTRAPDAELRAALQSVYGLDAEVTVSRETALLTEPSGKFRLARTSFAWDEEAQFEPDAC